MLISPGKYFIEHVHLGLAIDLDHGDTDDRTSIIGYAPDRSKDNQTWIAFEWEPGTDVYVFQNVAGGTYLDLDNGGHGIISDNGQKCYGYVGAETGDPINDHKKWKAFQHNSGSNNFVFRSESNKSQYMELSDGGDKGHGNGTPLQGWAIGDDPSFTSDRAKVFRLTKVASDGAEWMSRVDGSKLYTELSIPGTHESGCVGRGGPFTNWSAQCHEPSDNFTKQMYDGIRTFDLRSIYQGGILRGYHGLALAYQNYDWLKFEWCARRFLQCFPTEVICVSINDNELQKASQKDLTLWRQKMKSYVDAKPYLFAQMDNRYDHPLDSIRGKIILSVNTSVQDKSLYNSWSIANPPNYQGMQGVFWEQIDANKRFQIVKVVLNAALSSDSKENAYFSSLNANTIAKGPPKNAKEIAPLFRAYLNANPTPPDE